MYVVYVCVNININIYICTLPETNITPKNTWLEYYFPIGARPIFKGELLVSERVIFAGTLVNHQKKTHENGCVYIPRYVPRRSPGNGEFHGAVFVRPRRTCQSWLWRVSAWQAPQALLMRPPALHVQVG